MSAQHQVLLCVAFLENRLQVRKMRGFRRLPIFCLGTGWTLGYPWEVVSDCHSITCFVLFSFSLLSFLLCLSQTVIRVLLGHTDFFLLCYLCSPNALAYSAALLCIIRIFPYALIFNFFPETLSELNCAECAQLEKMTR